MRIGIDATIIGCDRPTGLGIYSLNLANALGRIHDDCRVWAGEDLGFNLPGGGFHRSMTGLAALGDRRYLLRPFWLNLIFSKRLKMENVDLLFSTTPAGVRGWKGPHVITVHDLIPLTFPEDTVAPVRWNFKYRLPSILARADAILTESESTKRNLVAMIGVKPEKITVIPLGYDRQSFHADVDRSPLSRYGLAAKEYILYVGNASKRKNLLRTIEAYGKSSAEVGKPLVICGKHSAREKVALDRAVMEAGVADRVIFHDYVPFRDLPALYAGAALFVFVSLYEGFGLPVLEAMACGTPVVTSKTTSLPEVAGDAAVLVDPFDVEAIASAMIRVVQEASLAKSMSDAGIARAEGFCWDKCAEETLQILQRVFAEHGHKAG